MIKKSQLVNKIHMIICIYLVTGWLFSDISCKILLFSSPTVMTQWGINNNLCILTQLENKYKKEEEEQFKIKLLKKNDNKIIEKEKTKENLSFIGNTFKKMGINISPRGITILTYVFAYHSFIQSYYRVVYNY